MDLILATFLAKLSGASLKTLFSQLNRKYMECQVGGTRFLHSFLVKRYKIGLITRDGETIMLPKSSAE